jgi:hypothetical protein
MHYKWDLGGIPHPTDCTVHLVLIFSNPSWSSCQHTQSSLFYTWTVLWILVLSVSSVCGWGAEGELDFWLKQYVKCFTCIHGGISNDSLAFMSELLSVVGKRNALNELD